MSHQFKTKCHSEQSIILSLVLKWVKKRWGSLHPVCAKYYGTEGLIVQNTIIELNYNMADCE